jgi:hypothetical protein
MPEAVSNKELLFEVGGLLSAAAAMGHAMHSNAMHPIVFI